MRSAASAVAAAPAAAQTQVLWARCREEAGLPIGDLAERIVPRAQWDQLVLPEPQLRLLRMLTAQLRRRSRVLDDWGFAQQSGRGLGTAALFAGPSGTGKTMAAEVIAGTLALDLYRIDLSQVVSKWLGETEKNLAQLFDAADAGGAVLLFDEADALFGKRSEVRDSHDRYANIEVSFLLQRLETYRGLAVLATNSEQAVDQAFLRRLRCIVRFPQPDAAQRAAIWQRVLPSQTPTEALRTDLLARLSVSGGTIRNIALTAAYLAADAGAPVRMADLRVAAEIECAKLNRPLSATETAGWT
jgi:SpoVK/Ycf46/Vps4 family AAA+-type ATPase